MCVSRLFGGHACLPACETKHANGSGPFLIVAPLSLLNQWQHEFETWTDLECVIYHGNEMARSVIRDYEFFHQHDGKAANGKANGLKLQVIVTSFEIAVKDCKILCKVDGP